MQKIKLTHINPTDIKGGASLAGYRVHKALLSEPEIDSLLFVHEKYNRDPEVIKFSNFILWQIERLLGKFGYYTGLLYLLSINWLPLIFKKRFRQTDVFLIRNIHGGFLPFWFPQILSFYAPVIWRLPDMWAFTGHCTFSYNCQKWHQECHQCPLLKDYPALRLDTTPWLFKWKKQCYQKSNLYMVAPSRWMEQNLKQSPIFQNKPIFYIPIGIDTALFKPQNKNTRLTLLIVSGSLKDKRKGGEILPVIFKLLDQKLRNFNIKVDVLWAGQKDLNIKNSNHLNHVFLGHQNEQQLAALYAQAHLHILPTLADNLPNTIIESLSCETPVVVFDVGGCSDAVKHLKTGYLAEPANADDFTEGIIYFLTNPQRLTECGVNGRRLVLSEFSQELQAQRYKELVQRIHNHLRGKDQPKK